MGMEGYYSTQVQNGLFQTAIPVVPSNTYDLDRKNPPRGKVSIAKEKNRSFPMGPIFG